MKKTENNISTIKKVFIPCGTYACKFCRAKRRYFLYQLIKKHCPKKNFVMLTLTLRKNNHGLKYNWKRINKHWDTLLKRLKRKFPNVKYFRVVELQKNGMPHIHALINCYANKWFIHKTWQELTGDSYICQFETVRSSCAGYVLKYFEKGINDIDTIREATGKKTKIFNWSRNFLIKEIYVSNWKMLKLCQTESEAFEFLHYEQLKTFSKYARAGPLFDVKKNDNRICEFSFQSL